MKVLRRLVHGVNRLYWRLARPITVGVRCILEREGRVLLVRHTYGDPAWYLPGGGVRGGETIEQAACREAAEEVGAVLGPLRLLGIYTNRVEGKSDHVAVLTCGDWTMEDKTDGEIETWAFYAPDQLPAGTSPGTRRRLAEHVSGQGPYVGRW